MRHRLRVVPVAQRQIRQAAHWWQENRSAAPGLFREELERAFDLITTHPELGVRSPEVGSGRVRRLHLSGIRYYLYYRPEDDLISVLALWHASRGSLPKI